MLFLLVHRRYLQLLLISLLLFCNVTGLAKNLADYTTLRFEPVFLKDGLSHVSTQFVRQDPLGRIWVGTHSGLTRFEAHKSERYYNSPDDESSLPNDQVRDLLVDSHGNIWIATEGGLARYREDTGGFERYNIGDIQGDNRLYSLFEDSRNRLWIGSKNGLVQRLPSGEFKWYRHQWAGDDTISQGRVRTIVEDFTGRIWVGTEDGGLDQLVPDTERFEHHRIQSCRNVRQLLLDRRNTFWVACLGDGLYRYDIVSGTHREIEFNERQDVRALFLDDEHRLWLGSQYGVILLDQFENEVSRFEGESDNPHGLTSGFVLDIYEDAAGTFWFSGYSGLSKWDSHSPGFAGFTKHLNTDNQLPSNIITNFSEDDHHVWVATLEGVSRWHKKEARFEFMHNELLDLKDKRVTIVENCAGEMWVGTMAEGIRIISPSGTIRSIRHDENDLYSIPSDQIPIIKSDDQGRCWVGTFGGGLALHLGDGRFKRYPDPLNRQGVFSSLLILDILPASDGMLWLSTQNAGITVLDPDTGYTRHYRHDPTNPTGLGSDHLILAKEYGDEIWFGTQDAGVSILAKDRRTFQHRGIHNGLRANAIYSMLQDEEGAIWLFMGRGVDVIEANGTTTYYGSTDGLMDDDFNQLASLKLRDGTFLAGGSYGFNAWRPNDIRERSRESRGYEHQIRIFQFNVLNDQVRFPSAIDMIGEVTVDYDQNVLGFEFGVMQYSERLPPLLEYRLEGFDDDWITAGERREATYTNLDAGRYSFQLRQGTPGGRTPPVAIDLTVLPAPWQTWWARTGYAILLLAFIGLLYSIMRNRAKLAAMTQLESEVLLRTQELEQVATRETLLFKELSHRVKNNMQVIISLLTLQSHTTTDEKTKQLLRTVQKRVQSLALVHDSLYETGSIGSIDAGKYLSDIATQLSPDGIQFGETIAPKIEVDCDEVYLDIASARSCGLIVNELVTNALKHAFTTTHIKPTIKVSFKSKDGRAHLSVADNGAGMEDPAAVSTPETMGFSIVTVLISQQLEGDIHVSGDLGTKIEITFPLEVKTA